MNAQSQGTASVAEVRSNSGAQLSPHELLKRAQTSMDVVRPFIGMSQRSVMCKLCGGEEGTFFLQKFIELRELIESMPTTRQTEGQGDNAIAYLHYFYDGSDWYITEKDIEGGVYQAFGFAVLNGDTDCAEYGYISILELVSHRVELDLHFKPVSMAKIKAKHGLGPLISDADEVGGLRPWVVVENPGCDDQQVIADFASFDEAMDHAGQVSGDVMRRLLDGTLTTEF